ncbi:MAG: hypothetical protein AAGJ46_09090 [Planctomycetota bacterium]
MAEALRPAGDVFHESLPPSAAYNLPCYRSRETALANVSHESAAQTTTRRLPAYVDHLADQIANQVSDGGVQPRRSAASVRQLQAGFRRPSLRSDLLRVVTFLSLLTAAACGLSWFFQ